MNWQETVKSETRKRVEVPSVLGGYAFPIVGSVSIEAELLKQAKATWEARQPEVDEAYQKGRESVLDELKSGDISFQGIVKELRDEAEQRGIRKVKEWVETHQQGLYAGQDIQDVAGNECGYGDVSHLLLPLLEWQTLLKGVEK